MKTKNITKAAVGLFYLLLISTASQLLTSCEKEIDAYDDAQAHLNFYNIVNEARTTTSAYSFVYHGSTIMQDTVWVGVRTMGFLSGSDRPIALKQVMTNENDALAGTDYVAFDDASLQSFYVVKANTNFVRIPVVVKRTSEMKTTTKTLCVTFADNGVFQPGYDTDSKFTVYISDILEKPTMWDRYNMQIYIGYWTRGMHQFIIDQTGEPWDDDYIVKIATGDSGFLNYMGDWLPKRLEEVNAERAARGQGPLMEDDGVTPVAFVKWNPWG